MHQHRCKRTLLDLKIGALHFLVNLCLILVAAGLVIYGVLNYDETILYAGIGTGVLWLISSLIFAAKASTVRCPLCMVATFSHKRCQKHRSAKPLLGSRRLRLSLSILFRGHYRCMYCGEPFDAIKVKEQSRNPGLRSHIPTIHR